jgi:CHAT domain-containing protein
MKNRLEVYESLVEICLSDPGRKNSAVESFDYIELAKSRSLAELLRQHGPTVASAEEGQSELVRRIREMREELNWYYRRIEIEQLRAEDPSPERIEKLQKKALAQETDLVRALRDIRSSEPDGSAMHGDGVVSLESIRACLPASGALIEYFIVKDKFIAAVLTREGLDIIPVTPVSRVGNLVRMLRFQLSKFRLGSEYIRTFEKNLLDATRSHLHGLYQELIAPLRDRLGIRHLIIVPHGALHYVPFHALFDGNEYLIDSFSISYAPSASVYALCHRKKTPPQGPPLILGVPDARAPFIEDEVRAVSKVFPGARLALGSEASEHTLRAGSQARLIHIATHGTFRQDNPLFSGVRLGNSYLSLYDLYQFKFEAELITLSGCATGLNVVAAGDELLGLIRGFLYAGAQSLLLTLWDVHDASTSRFMTSFYRRLCDSQDRAVAFQGAVRELRGTYPHPYYWAPFMLVGNVSAAS